MKMGAEEANTKKLVLRSESSPGFGVSYRNIEIVQTLS